MMKPLLLAAATVLLSACGATKYCLSEQEYQKATLVSDLKPAEGLILPQSAGALRMPPKPADPVPFGVEAQDGTGICLDQPPRMTPAKQKTSLIGGKPSTS